jgi:hypothetical protein
MSGAGTDLLLNIAAAALVYMVILAYAKEDWVRLTAVAYTALLIVLLIVRTGGQINAGLALALLSYVLLQLISPDDEKKLDASDSKSSGAQDVAIFDGVMNARLVGATAYNTFDPIDARFRLLPPSVNRMGGTQFSYSMWVMFDRGLSNAGVAGKTLFLRGDDTKYDPQIAANGANGETGELTASRALFDGGDYAIVCPRVSFLSANQIAVDLNTDRRLRERFVIGNSEESLDSRKNAISLIPGSFAQLTFVFRDNVDISNFERGIRVSFYLNDTLYDSFVADGSMRLNEGKLFVLPDGLTDCSLADFTYHNYALSPEAVARRYSAGFNKFSYVKSKASVPLVTTAYNTNDLYNYDSLIDRRA